MGTLLAASTSTLPAIHSPLAPASSTVLVDHTILWDDLAPMHFQYTPCLVKVTQTTSDSPNDTEFEFEFAVIHTNTGRLVSGKTYKLTADRTTYGIVHATLASTLPTTADLAEGRCVCVLMLNTAALSDPDLLADINASAVEGKWPRTAGEGQIERQATRLLRQVIQTPGVEALLPASLRDQIAALGL